VLTLLRARRERPRRCAEKRDEVATSHPSIGLPQARTRSGDPALMLAVRTRAARTLARQSALWTSLRSQFPANREINRESRKSGPSIAIFVSDQPAYSMVFGRIPYAREQGISKRVSGRDCYIVVTTLLFVAPLENVMMFAQCQMADEPSWRDA
jgi:hypothetical protein